MARNNFELNKSLNGKHRATINKYGATPKYFKSISPQNHSGETSPQQRLSPSSSPRTSPGLLAGHYAGCKFTEPPLPSALPPPPQHWMQTPHIGARQPPAVFTKQEPEQLAHQLKVLLKVQA